MEIIGLVVLVVLLVFILIIGLVFVFNEQDNKDDVRISLIANNLVHAIIKQQGKVNVKDLIYDCYIGVKNRDSNNEMCEKLKNAVSKMILLSIGNKDFNIRFSNENIEFYNFGKCKNGIESIGYRFKVQNALFTTNLRIC